jgi:hypothetical protein
MLFVGRDRYVGDLSDLLPLRGERMSDLEANIRRAYSEREVDFLEVSGEIPTRQMMSAPVDSQNGVAFGVNWNQPEKINLACRNTNLTEQTCLKKSSPLNSNRTTLFCNQCHGFSLENHCVVQ